MKKAIVLGGSRGIGKSISNSLKKLDLEVLSASSTDIDTSDLESVNKFAGENNTTDILVLNTGGPPIIEFKKIRRIPLGPYATFYFECYETILAQIQEMLYIEKGGNDQLKDELRAYNPLIPKGKELIATLMFEIDNTLSRTEFLNKVGGIEKKVFIKINGETINSTSEKDVDRTSAEGKASSVQFVHFNFTDEQIIKFKNLD